MFSFLDSFALILTLLGLELALSVDNVLIIGVMVAKLPAEQQESTRKIALSLALILRLALASMALWLLGLAQPIAQMLPYPPFSYLTGISIKQLMLILGGLFLIQNAVSEIYQFIEHKHSAHPEVSSHKRRHIIAQLIVIDAIFSIDSILTSIGLTHQLWLIMTSVILSFVVVMIFSVMIIRFINQHPSVKILALAFLITIGVTLVMEGLHQPLAKSLIYLPLSFALCIEALKIRFDHNQKKHTLTQK